MTREQYIRMNRGINDSADLPEDYLSAIYEEIYNNEIRMKATASNMTKSAVANERQRKLLANLQMSEMARTAQALMAAASRSNDFSSFTQATHAAHVRPMFRVRYALARTHIRLFTLRRHGRRVWQRSAQISKHATTTVGTYFQRA
jgi:brefeldin A-inhibited guanine nucleotide-exchange protein